MKSLLPSVHALIATLVTDIEHLPQGYAFWHGLPSFGRKSSHAVQKRWATTLVQTLFPTQLKHAALLACLNEHGVPDGRGRALYAWLLKVVYRNNASVLYNDWCKLKQDIEKQPLLLFKPKVKRAVTRPVDMPRAGMFTWHEYPPAKHPVVPTP